MHSYLPHYQNDAHPDQRIQVPGQGHCSVPLAAHASIPDGLSGDAQACQHQPSMPAASLQQHAQQDTSLLRHSHGATAQQQARHVQHCKQPQAQFATATAEGVETKRATAEKATTKESRAGLKQQQQQQQPDGMQQHSPSSRQSAMHSPRRHHIEESTPWSVSLSGCSTSPSSQQASNSIQADSRHVSPSARPAALLISQSAEAGSSMKHGARSARHDSALRQPLPSQKPPDESGASSPTTGRSASQSTLPECKERPGLSGWPAHVGRGGWNDKGINSTTKSISDSSSSSSSLDRQSMGAALSMPRTASQSIMVPLELPSPMPDSSSEGTALRMRCHAGRSTRQRLWLKNSMHAFIHEWTIS